ncbi:MAG: HAD-IA family hydrolase [Deltaproteobacteria bacterium]
MEGVKQDLTIGADLIIFDLDGTLIDSSEDIARAANMTLRAMGYGEQGMESIKENIGWGVKALLERLMPREGPGRVEEARGKFLDFYGKHLVVDTYPYPNVRETLSRFKELNKTMAVVTNKPVMLAQRILDLLDLSGFFVMVVGGDSFSYRKPHPEPIKKVVSALGAAPDRTVLIGDSPIDCEAGMSAGVNTVGVSYGFRGTQDLKMAGCSIIVDDFQELVDIIR